MLSMGACRARLRPATQLAAASPLARAAEGGVAGTRKYSAGKAGGGLLVAGAAATAAAAPLLGLDPWSLASIETGFLLATSASLAGEGGGWGGGAGGLLGRAAGPMG